METEKSWKYGIAWDDNLNTGNDKVDEQHKTLYQLTSDLIESSMKGESKEKIGERLDFLANYTIDHFAYEEKLMLGTDYPDFAAHEKKHCDFKSAVTELIDDYKTRGSTDELSKNLENTVVKWLVRHIQGEDIKIAAHVREKNKHQ